MSKSDSDSDLNATASRPLTHKTNCSRWLRVTIHHGPLPPLVAHPWSSSTRFRLQGRWLRSPGHVAGRSCASRRGSSAWGEEGELDSKAEGCSKSVALLANRFLTSRTTAFNDARPSRISTWTLHLRRNEAIGRVRETMICKWCYRHANWHIAAAPSSPPLPEPHHARNV